MIVGGIGVLKLNVPQDYHKALSESFAFWFINDMPENIHYNVGLNCILMMYDCPQPSVHQMTVIKFEHSRAVGKQMENSF